MEKLCLPRQLLIECKNIGPGSELPDYALCRYGFQIHGVSALRMNAAVNLLPCKTIHKKRTW
jgi:hypothetical protein